MEGKKRPALVQDLPSPDFVGSQSLNYQSAKIILVTFTSMNYHQTVLLAIILLPTPSRSVFPNLFNATTAVNNYGN